MTISIRKIGRRRFGNDHFSAAEKKHANVEINRILLVYSVYLEMQRNKRLVEQLWKKSKPLNSLFTCIYHRHFAFMYFFFTFWSLSLSESEVVVFLFWISICLKRSFLSKFTGHFYLIRNSILSSFVKKNSRQSDSKQKYRWFNSQYNKLKKIQWFIRCVL